MTPTTPRGPRAGDPQPTTEIAFRLEWDDDTQERPGRPGPLLRRLRGATAAEVRADRARAADGRGGPRGRDRLLERRLAGDGRWPRRLDHATSIPTPRWTITRSRPSRWRRTRPAQQAMAQRYAPARALGQHDGRPANHARARPGRRGAGHARPGRGHDLEGQGPAHGGAAGRWSSPPLARGAPRHVPIRRSPSPCGTADKQEVGAGKMRTGWIAMTSKEKP